MKIESKDINFDKLDGLIPAIVQHYRTNQVLMLGFMNSEAYEQTLESGKVCFFSRTKARLWTKGETSGNFLEVKSIEIDCDKDTLLILADPKGPTCHLGTDSCFGDNNNCNFLPELEKIIVSRKSSPPESSYTAKLMSEGVDRIAKKVGEEASEVVIEAIKGDLELLKEESADLLYHLTVVLAYYDLSLTDVEDVLRKRHQKK